MRWTLPASAPRRRSNWAKVEESSGQMEVQVVKMKLRRIGRPSSRSRRTAGIVYSRSDFVGPAVACIAEAS